MIARSFTVLAIAIAASGSCSDRAARNDRRAHDAAPTVARPAPGTTAEAMPPLAEREPEVTATRLSPTLGPVGQWVYVFGSGFVPGNTAVEVGGAAAVAANVYDSSQLAFTVPAGAHGTGPVTVIIPGARTTSRDLYTVGIPTDPPQLGPFDPASGPPGTWVMLWGANFVTDQTTITVDGVETPGHCYGPDALWFTVPAGATDASPISIRTPNGTATSTASFAVTR